MAKNAIADFDIVPANNTDIGGIDIRGAAPVQNFDDALRTLMAYQKVDYDKTSTFMRTVLDDADAATARATLGLDTWYPFNPIIGATGTNWMWELPASAKDWRLTMRGLRPATGNALVFLRCGNAGASADAGAADYYNQVYNIVDGVFSSAQSNNANSLAFTFNAAAQAPKRVVMEGSIGSTAEPWTASGPAHYGNGTSVISGHFYSFRNAGGRKPRIFVLSDVAIVGGDLVMEVRS